MEQEPADARQAISHLIWQSWQVVKFAVDADRREDWIWPTLAQAFQQAGRVAEKIGHGNWVTHRWLVDREWLRPLLEHVGD